MAGLPEAIKAGILAMVKAASASWENHITLQQALASRSSHPRPLTKQAVDPVWANPIIVTVLFQDDGRRLLAGFDFIPVCPVVVYPRPLP